MLEEVCLVSDFCPKLLKLTMDCLHFIERSDQRCDIHSEGFSMTWDNLEMSCSVKGGKKITVCSNQLEIASVAGRCQFLQIFSGLTREVHRLGF